MCKVCNARPRLAAKSYCSACNTQANRDRKATRLGLGICVNCCVNSPTDGFQCCAPCRAVMAKKQFALYHANKQLAIDYLGGKCHDCGLVTHQIEVYDFHHLDPTAKEMNVGSLFRLAWSTITHELNKCALLCANCHRVRERGIDEVNLLARCVAAGSPPPVFMRAAA